MLSSCCSCWRCCCSCWTSWGIPWKEMLLLASGRKVIESTATHVQKIVDSTVRVEECGPHGAVDIASGKSHCFHLSDGTLGRRAHSQRRGVIKGGILGTSTSTGTGTGTSASRRRSRRNSGSRASRCSRGGSGRSRGRNGSSGSRSGGGLGRGRSGGGSGLGTL